MSQQKTDEEIDDYNFNLDIKPRIDEEIDNLTDYNSNLDIKPRLDEEIDNSTDYNFNLDIKPRLDEEIDNSTDYNFNLDIKPEEIDIRPRTDEEIDIKPRTDEEIVNTTNYNFNLDIETLLNNSTTTRRAKRLQRTCYTPRPQNPFILYRRDMAVRSEFVGLKSSEISKKIGKMWKNETTEVKDLFNALARLAEKRHSEKYSDYSYSPKRRKKEQ
jgi:hypothetical protein